MVDKYSEEQLLSELKSGSERAFDIIYKMYAKRLFLFCFQYCKRKEDAEEIVLDVFLWLWRNNHKIKQGESLRYLIYLRARHFLINAFRKEAVSKMYNLPNRIEHEYGELWNREFQKVINKAINTTTDSKKLTDLQHCKRVAGEMIKDSGSYRLDRPFYKINNAFRLTGCHILRRQMHLRGNRR